MAITVPARFLQNVANADGIGGADVVSAFDRWAIARGMRGKDIFDTIAKVMQYWVSFAMSKIPQGDRAKVRANLMRTIRNYSALDRVVYAGKGKNRDIRRANMLRGTVASAIVAIINYKGARELARARSPQFYAQVAKYIGSREYSVSHHRAGLLPAINVLGRGKGTSAADRGTGMPKYKHPPGFMAHDFTEELASILVENFASQSGNHPFRTRPSGIAGLAGDAFDTALAEVVGMVGEFLHHDMANAAAASGFTVNGRYATTVSAPLPMPSMPRFAAA